MANERDLAIQHHEIKLKIKDASGPKGPESYWGYCPVCSKVIYDIYRDGPMSPDLRNRVYCTCLGEATPIVQQRITVFDVEDVEDDPEVIKEIRQLTKELKRDLDKRITAHISK